MLALRVEQMNGKGCYWRVDARSIPHSWWVECQKRQPEPVSDFRKREGWTEIESRFHVGKFGFPSISAFHKWFDARQRRELTLCSTYHFVLRVYYNVAPLMASPRQCVFVGGTWEDELPVDVPRSVLETSVEAARFLDKDGCWVPVNPRLRRGLEKDAERARVPSELEALL